LANRVAAIALARGADVLFIEAPFATADAAMALGRRHLTARAAGEIAREAGVGRIEPFHFSPRYLGQEALLLAKVAAAAGRDTAVSRHSGLSSSARPDSAPVPLRSDYQPARACFERKYPGHLLSMAPHPTELPGVTVISCRPRRPNRCHARPAARTNELNAATLSSNPIWMMTRVMRPLHMAPAYW
jgi:hypothetical protein